MFDVAIIKRLLLVYMNMNINIDIKHDNEGLKKLCFEHETWVEKKQLISIPPNKRQW